MYMHIVAAMETCSSLQDSPAALVPAAAQRPMGPAARPPAGVPVSAAASSPDSVPVSPPASRTWGARQWAILLVLCGALFLDALDVSMIGVALPVIRTDLHLTTSSLQWIVSAYVLGYGGLLLLGGRAADLLGRRRVFLVALALFAGASLLGGIVSGAGLLIAARFVKGMAAAVTAPAGLSLLTTNFAEGPMRNRAISIYSAFGASGFSLGLVLSGLLTEVSWRWTLLLPAPVALITLIAAVPLIPRGERADRRGRHFDVPGGVTVTAAMLLLVYTVVSAQQAGWMSVRTIASFAVVAVLLAGSWPSSTAAGIRWSASASSAPAR